jgi:PAS domain S-box-containing protein
MLGGELRLGVLITDLTERNRIDAEMRRYSDHLEEVVNERTRALQVTNEMLSGSRQAALNLMEDALDAQKQLEQANAKLRESEQRLKQAQGIAHLGSWELDLLKNRLTWSDEVYRIFGIQPQDFAPTYEAFLDAVHPDERAAVDAAYSGSVQEGRNGYEIEHRVIRRSSGEIRFVSEKCEHFRNEAGQIILSIGMVHDITERKQTEEALRKAHDELELRVLERTAELAVKNDELLNEIHERVEIERQLRIQSAAMEAAANGILITDTQGNIQWANLAMTQVSGYERTELLGQNIRIFELGSQDAEFYSHIWNTILSGDVWRGELSNRRKDGSMYMEEQTITPVQDEDGKILHFIVIKQDVTERKRAEKELERRNTELQALTVAEHEQRQLAEALVKAAIALNKTLKLDDVLVHILEQIKDVIPYQLADVMLLEGETFYDACHGGELSWPGNLTGTANRFPLAKFPLFKKLIETGQPTLIQDTRKAAEWTVINGLEWSLSFLSVPLLVEEKVIGFVNLFAEQPGFFTQKMCEQLVAFAAHAAVAIQNAWLFEQVRASSERLHSLSRKLVEIQENERRYISRELHDEAGQLLTSLMVDLRLLEKKVLEPERVREKIAEMENSLNQVLENLHRIAVALRPASLDHVGLVAALNQHIESVGEKNGLKINFKAGKLQKRLPDDVETVLYRVIQEALTNVVRHAHATRVDVILTERDEKSIIIIEDDGVGFDPESVMTGNHLGLFGIRERIEMIDGKLVIESAPGKGTTLLVEVNHANTVAGGR